MNESKYLTIILTSLIIMVGGCCIMQNWYKASVLIEQEKTKQISIQLQSKIDSLPITRMKKYDKKD